VAAGTAAPVVHGLGDFFLDELNLVVPARKATRLPGVRLRMKQLTHEEVFLIGGLPTLTVERTIADLVEHWVDLSLVAGAVRYAVAAGRLISPNRLVGYLEPSPQRRSAPTPAPRVAGPWPIIVRARGCPPQGWTR
jgi:hypothetical protein